VYSNKKVLFGICLLLICTTLTQFVFADENQKAGKEDTQTGLITKTVSLTRNTMELQSNRHAKVPDLTEVTSQFDLSGLVKIAETSKIELWFAEAKDTVRFVNKDTGYIWGTLPLEDARDLNQSWKDYGSSLVGIECYDESGMDKRYGLQEDTVKKYTYSEMGLFCDVTYTQLDISFQFSIEIEEDHILFKMDGTSLKETGEYKLKSLAFLPFLGTSYGSEIKGYFLIPDGPGALIRFKEPASYIAPFSNKVYGPDLGIDTLSEANSLNAYRPNDYIIPTSQSLMPLYGIVHGTYQNGLFSVIESGDEYASIIAFPAGLSTNYNWIMARFEFRQEYTLKTNNSGAGTFKPQEKINQLSPMLTIYIVDGEQANYDGMAVRYRNILEKSGILSSEERIDNKIPMRLEILGLGKQSGFIFNRTSIFTTVEEAKNIVTALKNDGITNLSLIYRNFTSNNKAGNKIENKLGNQTDFNSLSELITAQGGRFYYYLNPISANKDQINLRLEAANTMSTVPIKMVQDNYNVMYRDTYFYRISAIKKIMNKISDEFYGSKARFALDEIPSRLYGDYTRGKEVTRKQVQQEFIDYIETVEGGQKTSMYLANQYLWKYVQEMYDVPVVNSQFLYETDTVPFLQIVLKGKIDYYGTTLNTGTYSIDRILRYIEYGVYPSFITVHSDSIDLDNTSESDYFSTNFKDWEEKMIETNNIMNDALSHVEGKKIMEHKVLEPGVVRVTYEDGTCIYVNYNSQMKIADGHSINALWYLVTE